MDAFNSNVPEEMIKDDTQPTGLNDENNKLMGEIDQLKEEVSYLRDLFVRRLNDDKQKNAVIQKLAEGASFAFIEPFLYDIILLLDRLEKANDDFVQSAYEELFGIINRRGVERIKVTKEFDPSLNKAVKVVENPTAETLYVSGIIRNGYTFSGKVIRPAEVVIVKPESAENGDAHGGVCF